MRKLVLSGVIALFGNAVAAEDAALLLGVEDYSNLEQVENGITVPMNWAALDELGFGVNRVANGAGTRLQSIANRFAENVENSERIVVILTGRFANDGQNTWFLGADSSAPSLFGIGQDALSVDHIMTLLAAGDGQSVVMIGNDPSGSQSYDDFTQEGLGPLDLPRQVTLVTGTVNDINALFTDVILVPGESFADAVSSNARIELQGAALGGFFGDAGTEVEADPADDAAFEQAKTEDTELSYLRYIAQYPQGQHLEEARARIEDIENEPFRSERIAEEALNLNREQRQDIQRDLALLGYDTRGIDGIFGPGTRASVSAWQVENNHKETSYLTSDQIVQLDAQAARRAKELEEEAARQAAEKERLDRAFWAETGAKGDETGFRTYLQRYPDGQFADLAREELARIEDQNRAAAEAEDSAAWDQASSADTIEAYSQYLAAFPNGSFAEAANARISEARQSEDNAAAIAQATQVENSLGLDPFTKTLIEGKLEELGLSPGRVDGQFNDDTRRAIRRYQSVRELGESGFINQETAARLLADTIGAITGGN